MRASNVQDTGPILSLKGVRVPFLVDKDYAASTDTVWSVDMPVSTCSSLSLKIRKYLSLESDFVGVIVLE